MRLNYIDAPELPDMQGEPYRGICADMPRRISRSHAGDVIARMAQEIYKQRHPGEFPEEKQQS